MKDWSKPKKTNDLDIAFGMAGSEDDYVPPYKEIPEDFRKRHNTLWHRLQAEWFFGGVQNLKVEPKEGIDPDDAVRHLSAIQRSFGLKHEHKEASFAYLASLWFENATWEKVEKK